MQLSKRHLVMAYAMTIKNQFKCNDYAFYAQVIKFYVRTNYEHGKCMFCVAKLPKKNFAHEESIKCKNNAE